MEKQILNVLSNGVNFHCEKRGSGDTSVSNAEWKEAEEKFSIAKAEALIRKKAYRYKEIMLKKWFIASISAIALLLLYIIFR